MSGFWLTDRQSAYNQLVSKYDPYMATVYPVVRIAILKRLLSLVYSTIYNRLTDQYIPFLIISFVM